MAEVNNGIMEKAAPQENGAAEDKSFQERLNDIPMYTMTLNQLCSLYTSIKDRNEVLKKAFNTGEYYAKTIAETAKPVVASATTSALAVAKPVIGEVKDPAAALDSMASKTLAGAEKRFPIIKQTPTEIAETTKEAIRSTAATYMEKLQGTAPAKTVNKQVENVISLSELMVEICFPTDGSDPVDLAELEKEEESEHQGHVLRVTNLKDKLKHRGTRKLMTMKPIQASVDAVQYAQQRMVEMNQKLGQGTNYVKEKADEAKTMIMDKKTETEEYIQEQVAKTRDLMKEKWDHVYSSTMYIPSKAIKVTGEVFVSTKEIVFAYTKAHSVTELPHAVVEMMEKHYASLKETAPQFTEFTDKAVAFVVVPAQVVSEYILSSRPVQWIIPSIIVAEEVKIMNEMEMSELEGCIRDKE